MPSTVAANFAFVPKVWQDHIMAYFDRKLVYGAFALRDDGLTQQPGLTQNFPYFKKIGAAQEPEEDEGLAVDNLTDDSFSVTVKEVSKAVGATKKAFKVSAARTERVIQEIQEQIGRVMAEKVDADLYTEFAANATVGYQAAAAGNTMNIRTLNTGKIKAFGDKHKDAVVCFMHSFQFLDMMTDSTAGFLQANAIDPMFMVEGFEGRLAGMAIISVDTVGKNTSHGTPRALAAAAVAIPALPPEATITPLAGMVLDSRRFSMPRALKLPATCRCSSFSQTSPPRKPNWAPGSFHSGVWRKKWL